MDTLIKKYIYILDSGLTFERKKKHMILSYASNPKEVLNVPEEILGSFLNKKEIEEYQKLKHINIEEKWNFLIQKNIGFTYYGANDYPDKLLNIPDPPFAIYYKGELPKKGSLSVGIIGARQNSDYGSYMAKSFAEYLAKNNINVISGMALGIDGISQRAALLAGGKSYGVLGCGVDEIYPPSNKGLYHDLINKGGVISEYPPTVKPIAKLFPPRNRIISGLSDCLLVVEAKQKSGTLITVDMALEQGKEVFVIPGRCTDALSYGCNNLLRNGASCVCSPENLIEDMGWNSFEGENLKMNKLKNISKFARELFNVLDFDPKTQDDILTALQEKGIETSVSELSSGLLELELNGIIRRNFGQYSAIISEF